MDSAALLTGRDPEGPTWSLAENRHLLVLLATSLAALIGCGVALLVRRSASPPAAQTSPRPLATKPQVDPDPDDGRQKVTVFFCTQTGTAEGFAKALVEEAKARYDKAVFKVVDLDDYTAEDEYEEKLKKETIALFFLATYGDGEPTDNAERFYKWLSRGNERGEWLSNLWFALFGLGNRQYEHFNKVGKVVDQLLAKQGGKCIVPLVLEMMINALRMTSTHGRNCYGLNWINCSVLKMILQQHQLLRQLLFRNVELCLSNQRTPHISTSLSVSPMVMLSMTFNILAGQMWLCSGSFIHQLLTSPAFI